MLPFYQRKSLSAFMEALMAILRKCGVMRNFLFEAETSEPAPDEMHA